MKMWEDLCVNSLKRVSPISTAAGEGEYPQFHDVSIPLNGYLLFLPDEARDFN